MPIVPKRTNTAFMGIAILAAVACIVLILMFAASRSVDFGAIFSKRPTIEEAGSDFIFAPVTPRDHKRGADEPLVVWVEYSDFECPYCKRFYPTTHEMLAAYPDTLQLVYRHYPNTTAHELAYEKALASECAAAQGGNAMFWAYHDELFERANASGGGVTLEDLATIAVELGLPEEEFTSCLEEETFAYRVTEDMLTGMNAGVEGTPTALVVAPDDSVQVVQGVVDLEEARELIDALLAGYAQQYNFE